MGDYGDPIDITKYKYNRFVYYVNPFSTYQTNLIVKLILTEENFNFNLTKDDGSDFRLMDCYTGANVLKMWKAYWSKANKYAVLFFKIPSIVGSASVSFKAYWGNIDATDVSDPDSLGFLFYESFPGSTIPTSKWSGSTSAGSSTYGYLFPTDNSFTSITSPLYNNSSWILEAGIYANFGSGGWNSSYRAIGFGFVGTENGFSVYIMHVDRIQHNATVAGQGTWGTLTQTYGGLEPYSYQEVYIDYYEPRDAVTVKLKNRNTYDDVEYNISRQVLGDTRINNIICYGKYYLGAYPTYINWLIIRKYDGIALSVLDGSDLYIPYEYVAHQNQDFREFSADFTNVNYQHESSFGGNSYKLSDEGYDSDVSAWASDDGTALEDSVALTIHTGWHVDVTDRKYTHFDSSHVLYYNASKLSDNDSDNMQRNFWYCTTASGWAAIRFNDIRTINAFRVKATTNLLACPKNFSFYGSNINPSINLSSAMKLIDGTFEQTTDWQARVIGNTAPYKYYILDIQDTYGGSDIQIQEWEMMDYLGDVEKKFPKQIRLHPALYNNWEYNFPYEISFQGSLDGLNWTTLLPWTRTYTPFIVHYSDYGYWQRYSFPNNNGYWSFRLLCRGNWEASNNKIIIGEWSIHELAEEEYIYRVLDGSTNNVQQIWATNNCGLDDEHGIIFLAGEKFNKVSSYKLIESEELPSDYEDFNVL